MPKDFAARTSSSASRSRKRRGNNRRASPKQKIFFHGPSFCFGAILGAAIIVLGFYAPELLTKQPTQVAQVEQAEPEHKVKFKFPQILRESEVEPNVEGYEVTLPSAEQGSYSIQAASFRSHGDAENLRARLLLQNLPVRNTRTEINGERWYRVVVGPFEDKVLADRAMTRLRELDLSAIWLRS